ncbi:MAG TPA: phasin family protein [Alphaproteobacteria bacterium]|nr:phasin family protein [Alphaproteobacteria bacterium]
MSRPAANPFFETDFSKFVDMSKMMGEFKMPTYNVEAVMAAHRKNIETMSSINQACFESMQGMARRQAEWARQCLEEGAALVNAMMAPESPEEKVVRQAEASKAAMERCMANAREIAETVTRNNCQAMETLGNRLNEGLEEFRDMVRNGRVAA